MEQHIYCICKSGLHRYFVRHIAQTQVFCQNWKDHLLKVLLTIKARAKFSQAAMVHSSYWKSMPWNFRILILESRKHSKRMHLNNILRATTGIRELAKGTEAEESCFIHLATFTAKWEWENKLNHWLAEPSTTWSPTHGAAWITINQMATNS